MTEMVRFRAPGQAGVTFARINWGRWIADCPICPSGLALPRGWRDFRCLDCGARADVIWPANIPAIERVLMQRPDPNTRSWNPDETVNDLIFENLSHGILPFKLTELDIAGQSKMVFAYSESVEMPEVVAEPVRLQIEGM